MLSDQFDWVLDPPELDRQNIIGVYDCIARPRVAVLGFPDTAIVDYMDSSDLPVVLLVSVSADHDIYVQWLKYSHQAALGSVLVEVLVDPPWAPVD